MKSLVMFVVAAAFVAAAWGTDCVIEPAASAPGVPEDAYTDDTMELKWDSGTGRWWLCWYTGLNTWVGNDFDITTIAAYTTIDTIRLQSRSNWPNSVWDGFRLGIYGFAGGVPGSLIWGPQFVVPTGSTGWKDFAVGWVLPTGVSRFIAAQEQYYDYPSCEAFLIDNNPTFLGHSWLYEGGTWSLFESPSVAPYRNLMIRVIVDSGTIDVAPLSVGRVKALYY
jgi:hypothetical protein